MISIITPCLNRVEMISEAIQSVLKQNYTDVEHIIMDGGSTDGTLEVIGRYPHLIFTSQPDDGLYDAINKGIQRARGEWIGLLNTDDYYEPNVFSAVVKEFLAHPDSEAVVGKADLFRQDANGNRLVMECYPTIYPTQLLFRLTQGLPIFNAWFFRKRLFEEIGAFDTRYRCAADREFLIRFAMRAKKFSSLDLNFYHYRLHPGSLTFRDLDIGEAEFMFEFRTIAENYLDKPNLDMTSRRIFKGWHSQITSDQCITALKRKDVRTAWEYSRRGLQRNLYWPLVFAQRAAPRLRRLSRKVF